ncbi:MAG: hypothetical protein QOG90_99 [Actinomycetota bacterium]|jgi:hypothetical protein
MPRKFVVVVFALALLAAGCGGGKSDDKASTVAPKRTTTSSTMAADDATTSQLAPSATTTSTQHRGSGAAASSAPGSADPNAAPAPATPGTYDYAQSGSTNQGSVPPSGTLVVQGAGPSQVFARHADPQSEGDLYFTFGADGPHITRVVLKQQGLVITCTFATPVPAPPWPPTTGKTFNGHAACDNGFAADFSGSITGHQNDSVGGRSFEVVVVASTLHVTGNGIDVNVNDTQHWAPALRVPTYSHEVVNGTGPFGSTITGDVTSTLVNASPH